MHPEYWSGLPFPSPGDLPISGIEPGSPALQADTLSAELPGKPPNTRAVSSVRRREKPVYLFPDVVNL